jgi:translation initiation factor 1
VGDTPRFHNPFAALGSLPGVPKPEPEPEPEPGDNARQGSSGTGRIARAVVRYERAGRKGKAVTAIDKLDLADDVLQEWLKALKGTLGCGGTVEAGRIVLQGDHRLRLPALLTERGVRKVTVG